MKTKLLFPHQFKVIGLIMLIISVPAGVYTFVTSYQFPWLEFNVPCIYDQGIMSTSVLFGITKNNLTDELILIMTIIGGLLAACSKEKNEDEFIAAVRLDSLLWATYVNYAVLLICTVTLYGGAFWSIMVFNMFTLLIIFLLRFNIMLYRMKNSPANEK